MFCGEECVHEGSLLSPEVAAAIADGDDGFGEEVIVFIVRGVVGEVSKAAGIEDSIVSCTITPADQSLEWLGHAHIRSGGRVERLLVGEEYLDQESNQVDRSTGVALEIENNVGPVACVEGFQSCKDDIFFCIDVAG